MSVPLQWGFDVTQFDVNQRKAFIRQERQMERKKERNWKQIGKKKIGNK